MSPAPLEADTYARVDELVRVGRRAVAKAQEENRRRGVPNVYSINGLLYYELPSGELTTSDPYEGDRRPHNKLVQPARSDGRGGRKSFKARG
jgi:hypothetical protein